MICVGRAKKVTVTDAKQGFIMYGLKSNVDDKDITRLYNAAAEFVEVFLKVSNKFIADASSEDSTGTVETDDDHDGKKQYV